MSSREFDHAKLCNPHGEYPQLLTPKEFLAVRVAVRETLSSDEPLSPNERETLEEVREKLGYFDVITHEMRGLDR